MAMRDRERGTVFWSFGYPENIDQTHQTQLKDKNVKIQDDCSSNNFKTYN